MQKIPVTRDGKSGSEVFVVDASDVIKIDRIRDREVIVHTKDDQYYLDFSFDNLEEWLFEDGFRLLDSANIVNMNYVDQYDSKKGLVFLSSSREINKTASAARIHKEHIENAMQLIKTSDTASSEHNPKLHEELFAKIISETNDYQFLRSYATIRAVNERKVAEQKILHMAYHDSLTNLPNRTMFDEKLKGYFEEAQSTGAMMAVIFLDLDRFKVINDTLGHQVGDQLLQILARKLQGYVRGKDIVARFGGDEFIILLTNIAHADEAAQFAKGIPDLLKEPFVIKNRELFVTPSIGISIYPSDGIEVESLLKNADIAMYRSKEKGGNSYHFYHPDMNKRSLHRLNLEVHLHKALEREEFEVYYQPIVDLRNGSVTGMESLIRWNHPEWGMVSPGEFIPLAEETGLIVPIGNWVLKQSCMQNKEWLTKGYLPLVISVNISAIQFHQSNFVQVVIDTLRESGLAPDQLCLEITENVAMNNVPYIIETLQKLKVLGVRISIDDFGTGYSSLSYLKRFHVHTLKIDQSFIRDISFDEDSAAIVTALIAMSRQLKIKSLAEGVETIEQLRFLIAQGCDEIQGNVFSKPIPASDFEHIIKNNKQLYLNI
ncbi:MULTISPECIES: EAL domain-containing protein [unclassified Paenibacillus]|uniref:EAL domain-containing protein n=1 Tax=unclassified Paenibacillus TaxID=185978 RepID=UPI001AE7DF28|nr:MULTISPECIES: EAL domain-containing protein [unclassified Paenibacillus]MBP1154702.1 diguanylate cyclase (GGDEF)-like protein [Paenibacillus sp. PvP091]MBP1169914.1 diguanylate cyclase (GGDEF)-like protein [Paenibacillus sp. PvR098]MBP2440942.1 diguanylate cyclase (GGDEF)-like protein [Paenibacillus sp. PvP052]